jgi:non-lysosomal glucosylceramidase
MIALPTIAWRRPLGVPYEGSVRPRVDQPMIDDGPWGGVPIGGMGAGSIGRTHRGDFARWHLDVGVHRFETIPACQFSIYVAGAGRAPRAHVLSTIRPDELTDWTWDLPAGAGTYHARFPYAWFEIDWEELPVRIVQRQFSPIIPGNYRESSYPVGIFETAIENRSDVSLTVGLMLTWQNLVGRAASADRRGGHRNEARLRDGCAGVILAGPSDAAGESWAGTFAIAAPEEPGATVTTRDRFAVDDGAAVWADFAADGRLDPGPPGGPSAAGEAIAAALAVTVELGPGETRLLPAALAWDFPVAEFGAGTRWHKRYTRFVGTSGVSAWQIAVEALRRREEWSAAIDAWQAPILDDPARPDWYRAAVFNELYYLVDGGTLWTDGEPIPAGSAVPIPAEPRGAEARNDGGVGRFGLLECFDYPFYNTLDVNFYASFALLELWPELERSVIRDFVASVPVHDPAIVDISWTGLRATRKCPGALPHDVGGPRDDPFLRLNAYSFQNVNIWKDLNCKFVLQLWRDVVVLDDRRLGDEAWPAVVEAIEYVAAFDRDGDGLPEHDGEPDQTYDTWPMHGPSAYGGLLWLAALRAGVKIGRAVGDDATVERFLDRIARGSAALERRLWTGRYYRYDDDGPSKDSIMADQLAGQWYADASGLGDVVPPERVEQALRTIHDYNVMGFAGGEMGAVNGVRPDGSVDDSSEQSPEVWVGTTYALAALMLGRGLTEEAWRTAWGAWNVTYNRGLWFRTPEAYDRAGNYRASLYLRPLAIWAIEHALAGRD